MIGWTSNYQETLKELGLEDTDVGFPEGPDRGSTVLIAKYISRIRTTLHAWFENILEVRFPTAASGTSPLFINERTFLAMRRSRGSCPACRALCLHVMSA